LVLKILYQTILKNDLVINYLKSYKPIQVLI